MKRTIKLKESELKRMIAESVRRILREMDNDYEGNDLDYDSIQMQAMSVIPRMHQNGQDVSWRSVAEEMGFRLETLNGEDMELLKDAIEETMMEDENPYYREDADFENDFKNLPYVNESINRIVNESVKRVLNETSEDWYAEEDYNGQTGKEGEVKSYDIGQYYLSNAEVDAEENGYEDVAEWLKAWFFEIQPECPWYWQKMGSGYGYNGDTIFKVDGVVCKDIYGQLMFDEYPQF